VAAFAVTALFFVLAQLVFAATASLRSYFGGRGVAKVDFGGRGITKVYFGGRGVAKVYFGGRSVAKVVCGGRGVAKVNFGGRGIAKVNFGGRGIAKVNFGGRGVAKVNFGGRGFGFGCGRGKVFFCGGDPNPGGRGFLLLQHRSLLWRCLLGCFLRPQRLLGFFGCRAIG